MRTLAAVRFGVFLTLVPLLAIACNDPTSPGPGDLIIVVATTGIDADEDGYLLSVDGVIADLLPPNGEVRIPDLELGEHVVRIEGQLPSCTIEGPNPRTIEIARGTPTTVRFTVTCAARFGYIDVATSTTGRDTDLNGYLVSLDGLAPTPVSGNGGLTLGPLLPGVKEVVLSGVSRNCTVAGDSVYSVTIAAGQRANLNFAVTCIAFSAIRVTAVTTGVDLDNTYGAYAYNDKDGGNAFMPSNGTVLLDSLVAGSYTIGLYDAAINCDVAQPTRTATVAPGDTARITFDINCITARQLVYMGEVASGNTWRSEIFSAKMNGADVRRLTNDTFLDGNPSWGPDGRIVFASLRPPANWDIYVMSSDGSNQVRLTTSESMDTDPTWSPDGSRIVFVSNRDGNDEIYVMNADGTNLVRLTNSAGADTDPAWSPDGSRIAFRSARDGNDEIYVMASTGSGVTRLTRNTVPEYQPTWSPDGGRIAFTRIQNYTAMIVIIFADGLGETVLPAYGSEPSWSPDGSRIAFTADDYYNYGVAVSVMRPDGTVLGQVASPTSYSPGWRP